MRSLKKPRPLGRGVVTSRRCPMTSRPARSTRTARDVRPNSQDARPGRAPSSPRLVLDQTYADISAVLQARGKEMDAASGSVDELDSVLSEIVLAEFPRQSFETDQRLLRSRAKRSDQAVQGCLTPRNPAARTRRRISRDGRSALSSRISSTNFRKSSTIRGLPMCLCARSAESLT